NSLKRCEGNWPMRIESLHPNSARALTVAALLAALAALAVAQIDTGAIVGTVRDPSGAAIPKAAVTLSNPATGVKQTTATNDAGEYQFGAVPPGKYSISASAAGFGAQVQNEIEIHVQSRPSVDFALKVGNVAE